MRHLRITLLSLAVALLAAPLVAADGRIPIASVPYTINASGHYYLTQSFLLNSAATAAITISANDVDLDLNGQHLSHIGSGVTYGVYISTVSNITVHHGSINAPSYGVYQDNLSGASSNIRIADLHFLNNNASGYAISITASSPGVTSGLVLENNVISSANRPSIDVHGVLAGRISGNVITGGGTSNRAIYVVNSKAFEIAGNSISGGSEGVFLDNSPAAVSAHTVAGNTVQNCVSGIRLSASQGNLIRHNTLATGTFGIVLVTTSDGNVFEENAVTGFVAGFDIAISGGTKNVYVNNRWPNNTTAVAITPAGNQSGGNNCDGTVCN